MASPDPAGFNAASVRDNFRIPMVMGEDPDNPVSFIMPPAVPTEYTGPVDDEGVPYDPDALFESPTEATEISATCAVELRTSENATDGVDPDQTVAVVTILDEDWEPVQNCVGVRINDVPYIYKSKTTQGLFSIAVHTVIFEAGDI